MLHKHSSPCQRQPPSAEFEQHFLFQSQPCSTACKLVDWEAYLAAHASFSFQRILDTSLFLLLSLPQNALSSVTLECSLDMPVYFLVSLFLSFCRHMSFFTLGLLVKLCLVSLS